MIRRAAILGAFAIAVVGTVVSLHASDMVGVYCAVQKVVMAPDECHPTTVQIWGACALARPQHGDYSTPEKGYLYYSAPKGQEDTVLKEWTDLKSVAGTGEVVGFGGRFKALGHMRPADEKPAKPDEYPIEMGVVKIADNPTTRMAPAVNYPTLIAELKRLAGGK